MRPESLYFLFSPITSLKGVGGETAKSLTRLLPAATALAGASVPIVRDLLFHLPVGLVDRRATYPLNATPADVVATFVVTVEEHLPPKQKRFGKQPYKVRCANETGDITLVFFHAREDYIKGALPVGAKRVISGRTEQFDYHLQMTHPDIIAPLDKLAEVQRPEPVYPLTIGLSSRRIAKIVEGALAKLPELPEWINIKTSPFTEEVGAQATEGGDSSSNNTPSLTLPREGGGDKIWLSWKAALAEAHHPQSEEELSPLSPARLRLAYDEMLANQLHLGLLRRAMQAQPGRVIAGNGSLTNPLLASLPFALTGGQQHVYKEISDDMARGGRMTRLLQGDVGSGKTIVALLAMLRAVEDGLQAALMVPTELIAQQHFEVVSRLVSAIRHPPAVILLTGSVKGQARKDALQKIASGEAQIIVGTHALFQDHVEFKSLALAVIDEQHRFGVAQRMALSAKGEAPHILHMTATPIPRSLSMTLYGDMDISTLREKPAERLPITTRLIPLGRYQDIMERLKAALDRGEKAYWICPLIEDDGDSNASSANDIAAAQSRYTEFKARFGNCVGLVHGRMKVAERNAEMQRFASGEVTLLVATTVVEVGVDVRDATIIVIEQAERFGLAQLHQLRGRVGRGDKPSACVLLYSPSPLEGEGRGGGHGIITPPLNPLPQGEGKTIVSRLSVLRDTEDGFKIAEADLALRGGGDLLGTRQSGLPRFIFSDLLEHQTLIAQAKEDVAAHLAADPSLAAPRGKALRLLLQLFGYEES